MVSILVEVVVEFVYNSPSIDDDEIIIGFIMIMFTSNTNGIKNVISFED